MAVFYNTDPLPVFKKAVITIGTFDGVHEGHKTILKEVVSHAAIAGGESILLTFDPHPRKVIFPHQTIAIITPLQEKLQLVTDTGIEHIVVVPFSESFAGLSATEYIEQFLVKNFNPYSIVIGYDHRYGHDRTGDINLLKQYGAIHNFEVVEIPAQLIANAAVSSTKIRNAIIAGNIDEATDMLGRQYSFTGKVVHGRKLGRTLGYPTANLEPIDPEQVLPDTGIFAVGVVVDGAEYNGMMSIGYNPTVTDTKTLKIEVNVFDFDMNIYNKFIDIIFQKKLRDEQKFDSLSALVDQLHADKAAALAIRKIQ
ncbi:MAG: bifunctional riboflavin kinase/FAD synthetase [Taibaiella sp.]|nr:bifunctional riboflavin kinase/FAD synthetase [Taibaiella sp.]